MVFEGDVDVSDVTAFHATDRSVVGQALGGGQDFVGAAVHFHSPPVEHHPVLRGHQQITIVGQRAFADQDRGEVPLGGHSRLTDPCDGLQACNHPHSAAAALPG